MSETDRLRKRFDLETGRLWEEIQNLRLRIAYATGASTPEAFYTAPEGVPNDAQYLVLAYDADLSAERLFAAGDGLGATDGGAGSTYTVDVDVTDFIDTDYGLTESTNDIRINNGVGLTFSTGALIIDQSFSPTWTGTHTFEADIQVDADIDFVGAQAITTTAGNLTILPAGDIVLDPTGLDVLPGAGYEVNLGALTNKYLTLHAAELWVETLVAQETMATIGGRILVGPTTMLTSDLSAASESGSNQVLNPGFET